MAAAIKPMIKLEFPQMVMKTLHSAEVDVPSSLNQLKLSAFKAGWDLVGKHFVSVGRTPAKEHGSAEFAVIAGRGESVISDAVLQRLLKDNVNTFQVYFATPAHPIRG